MNPAPLIELATAYWHSATLIAGVRLDLFTRLAEGEATAAELAGRLGTDVVATDALITGLCSLGLVTKAGQGDEARFANAPLADTFLVAGRPAFLGPALLYNGDVYPLWADLHEVVRGGDATRAPDQYLGDDAGRTRNFVYGMHHRALGVGRAVAQAIRLGGHTRLADIGGGPGTYSALLTGSTPGLTAEVLDLPGVVAIASEIVASMGAADRVQCTPYDYYRDALPGRYDAALISGVLHREQPAQVRSMIARVAEAMDPGGVLYISDVMLDDDRAGPIFAAMFALNMRVLAHDGRCHSVAEQAGWLAEAGFRVTEVVRLPAPIHYTIIRAERLA